MATPMANGPESKRPAGAEFSSVVVPSSAAIAVESEPEVVVAVPVPLDVPSADDEAEVDEADPEDESEGDGLGHTLSYTNCSGSPSHSDAASASYVPLGYIQQVPERYGELLGLCGLKTT
jgi:hypothetical protein